MAELFEIIKNRMVKLKVNSAEIAVNLGVTQRMVEFYIKGEKNPSFKNLQKLSAFLQFDLSEIGFNKTYVVPEVRESVVNEAVQVGPGEGKKFTSTQSHDFIDLGNGKLLMNTPLIQAKAQAGYLTGWGDPEYVSELPTHPIVVDKAHRGEYKSFEVTGDSMDDGTSNAIQKDDIVTGRKINRSLWRNKLHIKKFSEYIVVATKGVLIKRIIEHDIIKNVIKCQSANPDKTNYPDFEISLESVLEILNVVQVTKKRKS